MFIYLRAHLAIIIRAWTHQSTLSPNRTTSNQEERHGSSYGYAGKFVRVDLEKSWHSDGTPNLDHVTILDLAQVVLAVLSRTLILFRP